jgi:SNF2 family DNA or RNA helicase
MTTTPTQPMLHTPAAIAEALRELADRIRDHDEIMQSLRDQAAELDLEQTGEGVELKDVPRLEALRELLEDLTDGHKVIVWAVFKANYAMIGALCRKLGIEYTELTGEIKDKDTNVHKFRTDPKCRVLIANPGAGGVGINLVEASYSIYYSKGFSLEHDIQSEARNYRGGSHIHEKITRIDLVAKGTIDDIINEALRNKLDVAQQVLANREKL